MTSGTIQQCIAFDGSQRIASGSLPEVARQTKKWIEEHETSQVLIFDDVTSEQIEIDFRECVTDVVKRVSVEPVTEVARAIEPETPRGPGRPKLGVVAREVTLLPRHWEWLNIQPGGASVALRKLVEEARKTHAGKDRLRQAQESAYRFLSTMAGNFAGFEEASRALFAGDAEKFQQEVNEWPKDVRDHAQILAKRVFN